MQSRLCNPNQIGRKFRDTYSPFSSYTKPNPCVHDLVRSDGRMVFSNPSDLARRTLGEMRKGKYAHSSLSYELICRTR